MRGSDAFGRDQALLRQFLEFANETGDAGAAIERFIQDLVPFPDLHPATWPVRGRGTTAPDNTAKLSPEVSFPVCSLDDSVV